jgi:hypothetical protein
MFAGGRYALSMSKTQTPANPVVRTTPVRTFPGWVVETHADGQMWVANTRGHGLCAVDDWDGAIYFIRHDQPKVG